MVDAADSKQLPQTLRLSVRIKHFDAQLMADHVAAWIQRHLHHHHVELRGCLHLTEGCTPGRNDAAATCTPGRNDAAAAREHDLPARDA